MGQVFNENTFTAQYISSPGEGGYPAILRFSAASTGGKQATIDEGFLCQTAAVNFTRNASKAFFLNVKGLAYIIGRGTGTLNLTGMLGNAESFSRLFGENVTNPCNGLFTVELDAFGLKPCDSNRPEGTLILTGVMPTTIAITASIREDNGALWYTANANFEVANLAIGATAAQAINNNVSTAAAASGIAAAGVAAGVFAGAARA